MLHGLDTGFLIAAELVEHAEHIAARDTIARLLAASDRIAIAPQILAEFIHVATDPRHFAQPLDMNTSFQIAELWWTATDTVQVFPDNRAVWQFLDWLRKFTLGRKRLLDTLLAATYLQAGIRSILTTNQADFQVFGAFTCIAPTATTPNP